MLHATQRLNNLEQTHEQPLGGSTLRARQNVTDGLTMGVQGNLEGRSWPRYSHPDRLRRLVCCDGEHAPRTGKLQYGGQRGFYPLRDFTKTETTGTLGAAALECGVEPFMCHTCRETRGGRRRRAPFLLCLRPRA